MKNLLNLQGLALWLFLIYSTVNQAADLTFTPATPVVTINQTITLSVAGAIGQVRWQPIDGKIQGEGTQVTYLAPDTVGKDTILVVDSEDNTGILKVVITPPNEFSLENAQWEVFNMANSGLPDNWVNVLLPDSQDGLWVGTGDGGLAHYAQGHWQVFNTDNSGLPSYYFVNALLPDSQGGLWIGTFLGGLVHYAQGVFKTVNSGLPDNWVMVLHPDSQGGLWVGTLNGGLAHYAQGSWQVFNTDNSGLPDHYVRTLLSDSQGGLWVGTGYGGLAHYAQGSWQVFNTDNSGLPDNFVSALLPDSQGGLWVGTSGGGLAHYAQGQWQVFNTDNSGLPTNVVSDIFPDNQGGLWVGTWGGLAHYAQGQWQVFRMDNSGLPDNWIDTIVPDNQGGLWIGTSFGGLAHLTFGRQTGTTSTDIPQVTPVTTVINTVSDCTGSNTVGDLCNAGGKTITVTDIKPSGTLANGILNSAVTSQGWVSNVTLTDTGKLSGGVVTGYIKNEGIMLDFEFKGLSIIGGILGGVIINTSQVGGYFQDVTLPANTKITGGVLKGTIKGDKQSPALLEKVTVKAGSHLSGVKLGTGVKLEQGVVVEPLEETLTTTLPNLGPAIATDAKGQPVPTQTEMMGGISLDGKTFKPTGEVKQLSETVAIVGRLQPDPAHVKQKVSLFVTVTYQPTKDSQEKYFFKLNAQGGLIPWTEGDLASLGQDLFQSEVMLPATFDVTMYHGVFLATGIVKVNFGYLLPDSTAVQSQPPIELTVTK